MKIGAARDRLEKRGDQTSLIIGLMRTGMEGCKMILVQPLYLWRDGGNIHSCPRRLSLPSLWSLFLEARIFRAPPPLDAHVQVSNKRGQDDQPAWKIIVHEVLLPSQRYLKF